MREKRKARVLGEALIWYHFVPGASEAGSRWYRNFRDSGAEDISYRLDVAVDLLRKSRQEAGCELLAGCRRDRESLGSALEPATREILEEALQGAEGYLLYLRGDYPAARWALENAEAAVGRALEAAPFLLGFTQKCRQLCLNKARVARSERRWDEMRRLIALATAMVAGREPLCTLARGPVYVDELYAWLAQLAPADPLEEEALRSLRNRERNIAAFDHLAQDAAMIPNVAIAAF